MKTTRGLPLLLLIGCVPTASAIHSARQLPVSLQRYASAAMHTIEAGDHLDESRFLSPVLPVPLARGQQPPLSPAQLDRVRAEYGHVAARRRVAQQIKLHNASSEEIQDYALRYKRVFKQRTMVYLLHVSKSAGSLLCVAAMDNGCNATLWNAKTQQVNNCFADGPGTPADGPRWGTRDFWAYTTPRDPVYNTCGALTAWYATRGITFTANENTLPEQGPCVGFWNVMSMRNPINRLVSHLSNLNDMPYHTEFRPEDITPRKLVNRAPIITDNYYARSLLGPEVYGLPAGGLNRTHVDRAKAKMEAFDTLLLKSPELASHVSFELGWPIENKTILWQDNIGHHADRFNKILEEHWTEEDWASIREANWVDLELFRHAQSLREQDELVLKHPVFLKEIARKDRDEDSCQCGLLCRAPNWYRYH